MDLHPLLSDSDPAVRQQAIRALLDRADQSAIELVRGLVDDDDPQVRVEALEYLVWADQHLAAREAVIRLTDGDPQMRAQAIDVVGHGLEADESLEAWDLILPLIADPDSRVRFVARSFLTNRISAVIPEPEIRARSPVDWIRAVHAAWLVEERPNEGISAFAFDPSPVVRLGLVEALASPAHRATVLLSPAMINRFLTDPDPRVREAALDFPGV